MNQVAGNVNSHWIPKVLTKDWEFRKGKFKYYCFEDKKIKEADSAKLFAEHGLFSDETEDFLNKFFENPISHTLNTAQSGDLKTDKWKVYRSIVLFLFHLVVRYNAKHTNSTDVKKFFNMDETELNTMVQAVLTKYAVLKLDINPLSRLFFPSTALFTAIGVDSNMNNYCHFCVPINGNTVFCMAQKGFDEEHLRLLCDQFNFQNLSVSNGANCDKVLIHPDFLDQDDETLVKAIEDARQGNDRLVELHNKLSDALGKFEKFVQTGSW